MKDEELAEEYYYKTYPVTLNIGEEERKKEVTDIFLAGLKAGRPQWHDLEKDPTDLPKNKHNVWCKCLDQCGEGWYDKDTNIWTLVYRDYHVSCIEAWCELPNFDKE